MKPFTPAKIKADLIFALSLIAVFGFSLPSSVSVALIAAAGVIAGSLNFGEALLERLDPKLIAQVVAEARKVEPDIAKLLPDIMAALDLLPGKIGQEVRQALELIEKGPVPGAFAPSANPSPRAATGKRYKTGRLPAVRPPALKDFAAYASAPLAAPPAEVRPPQASFPMDGNIRYGDCTIAGADHLARAWNAETGKQDHLPTEGEIVAEYLKLTGGEDTGLVEADVLKTWHGEGLHLFGGQIAGYAPIDPKDLPAIHQAIAFYGGAYLGINVGAPQQEQFSRREPWTWVGGQEEDGHCVVALGYSADGGLWCATWGGIALLTAGFLAHGLEEAWVILSHQMVEARGDQLGVNLAALQQDLAQV